MTEEIIIKFTKEKGKWVISSKDEPNATEYYTSKAVALDMFEKVLQIASVPWRKRNELLKDAMKLGRGKLRRSRKK